MTNPLAMSDEEFSNLNGPPASEEKPTTDPIVVTEKPVVEKPVVEPVVETPVVETPVIAVVDDKDEEVVVDDKPLPKELITQEQIDKLKTAPDPKAAKVPVVEPKKKADGTTEEPVVKVETPATPLDYKVMYEAIMAPLKANGKVIELKTPEEAIQLMQMGANYTKKMQAITPYRKVLTMLENNSLLDEGKLSFLIDLDKKNPEAIRKLVKDAGIDPMDFDDASKATYLEGNHRVSDEEVSFKAAVEDLKSNPTGLDTLREVNAWDQASKEVLWKNPEILEVVHSQRENGIYPQIQSEIDRRRTLGTIPANIPFLTAYKMVGDEMQAANSFVRPASVPVVAPKGTVAPAPVVRVAIPKSPVVNSERVSAASTPRSTPRKTEKFINPLAMSDEDFLKQMADRL